MTDQVIALIENNGVSDYQVTDRVTARSCKGSPRFDTAVWPGYNIIITMQIADNENAAKILGLLKKFNKEISFSNEELLTVCSWDMDNCFFD